MHHRKRLLKRSRFVLTSDMCTLRPGQAQSGTKIATASNFTIKKVGKVKILYQVKTTESHAMVQAHVMHFSNLLCSGTTLSFDMIPLYFYPKVCMAFDLKSGGCNFYMIIWWSTKCHTLALLLERSA